MSRGNPAPLAGVVGAFAQRPFTLTFWDGTELPATESGGPTFTVRSSRAAVAHALRAPGQLGLGRAYVSGELDIDDIDAIASIGMAEHVGEWNIDLYAERVAGLLAPGGRLLNQSLLPSLRERRRCVRGQSRI
jgi:cyclopropane fatty-acyl-phospholipid synthase-like methyltransferase